MQTTRSRLAAGNSAVSHCVVGVKELYEYQESTSLTRPARLPGGRQGTATGISGVVHPSDW
jgi:hypothetical protein